MTVAPDDDLPCRELVELVTEHLEGTLDTTTEQRLLAHLPSCPGCANFVDQLRSTQQLAAALGPEAVPPGLLARLSDAYRRLP